MEGKSQQTSFIPKKSLDGSSSSRGSHGVSVTLLVSILVFVISLAMAGGVFIYGTYLNNDINGMKDSFTRNEKAFDPATISTFTQLSDRIAVAQTLLANHIAVSSLFTLLEQATLKSVRFTDFDFSLIDSSKATLSMRGQARNYNSVAKQAEVFNEDPQSKVILNPIFSDLNPDQTQDVIFSFTSDVDPRQLLYRVNLPGQSNPTINGAGNSSSTTQ